MDISPRNLASVIYFAQYIALEINDEERKKILTNLDEKLKSKKKELENSAQEQITKVKEKLEKELKEIKKKVKSSEQRELAIEERKLKSKQEEMSIKETMIQEQLIIWLSRQTITTK